MRGPTAGVAYLGRKSIALQWAMYRDHSEGLFLGRRAQRSGATLIAVKLFGQRIRPAWPGMAEHHDRAIRSARAAVPDNYPVKRRGTRYYYRCRLPWQSQLQPPQRTPGCSAATVSMPALRQLCLHFYCQQAFQQLNQPAGLRASLFRAGSSGSLKQALASPDFFRPSSSRSLRLCFRRRP